jgi:hypothetical protein
MRAMYNGRSFGRRGRLPLPSTCDQTKLIPAGADSASTVCVASQERNEGGFLVNWGRSDNEICRG